MATTTDKASFGDRLKALMRAQGLNQTSLDAELSPELKDLVIRFRAAIERIAELERERDEAQAVVERLNGATFSCRS